MQRGVEAERDGDVDDHGNEITEKITSGFEAPVANGVNRRVRKRRIRRAHDFDFAGGARSGNKDLGNHNAAEFFGSGDIGESGRRAKLAEWGTDAGGAGSESALHGDALRKR